MHWLNLSTNCSKVCICRDRVTFHDVPHLQDPLPLSLLRHAVFGKRSEINLSAPSQVSSKSFCDFVRYIFWTTDQQTCPLDLDDPRSTPGPRLEHLIQPRAKRYHKSVAPSTHNHEAVLCRLTIELTSARVFEKAFLPGPKVPHYHTVPDLVNSQQRN